MLHVANVELVASVILSGNALVFLVGGLIYLRKRR